MPSFSAPFYGNIKSLTVNPQDNSLWVVSEHPNGRPIPPTQILVEELLTKKQPNASVKTHVFPETAAYTFGHSTGLYVASKEGKLFRLQEGTFSVCHDVGLEFEFQGVIGFRDGRMQYPLVSEQKEDQGTQLIQQSNNKLLVVGRRRVLVVDVQEDGSLKIGKTIDVAADITAWAAETV